jgi:hypothetical protein
VLVSVCRSPILTHYQESCKGVPSIRALQLQAVCTQRFYSLFQQNMRAYFAYWAVNQWVTCCMELMGSSIVLLVALLGVFEHGRVSWTLPLSLWDGRAEEADARTHNCAKVAMCASLFM